IDVDTRFEAQVPELLNLPDVFEDQLTITEDDDLVVTGRVLPDQDHRARWDLGGDLRREALEVKNRWDRVATQLTLYRQARAPIADGAEDRVNMRSRRGRNVAVEHCIPTELGKDLPVAGNHKLHVRNWI